MALLRLPAGSRVQTGIWHRVLSQGARVRRVRIYRFDPDSDRNPRLDTYEIDMAACGPMVLDVLIHIKNETDSTLTFRRSCPQGISASSSMNTHAPTTLPTPQAS